MATPPQAPGHQYGTRSRRDRGTLIYEQSLVITRVPEQLRQQQQRAHSEEGTEDPDGNPRVSSLRQVYAGSGSGSGTATATHAPAPPPNNPQSNNTRVQNAPPQRPTLPDLNLTPPEAVAMVDCHICFRPCKGQRGLTTHLRFCQNQVERARRDREARSRAQVAGSALPRDRLEPSPAQWAFIRSLDVEEQLAKRGPRLVKRIQREIREHMRRVLEFILETIEQGEGDDRSGFALLLLFPRMVLRRTRGGAAGRRQMLQRIRRFEEGEWEALLAEASSEATPPRPQGQHQGGEVDRRLTRARRLARVGALSRACASLGQAPTLPPSTATIDALKALHPPPLLPFPQWAQSFVPPSPLILSEEWSMTALRSSSREAAPGPSGLTFEHLRDLLLAGTQDASRLFRLFHRVVQMLARGHVPPAMRRSLFAGELIGIDKGDGSPRPIAIGEVTARLMGRAVTLQMRESFARDLAPHQFGVGVPGGSEAVVTGVRAAMELDPDCIIIQMDMRNAFNSISRAVILEELRNLRPELVPLAACAYGQATPLFYRGGAEVHVLSSAEGARQGDPLGPVFFSYGMGRALRRVSERVPHATFPTYLDDITMIAERDGPLVGAGWAAVGQEGEAVGVTRQVHKCAAFSQEALTEEFPLPDEIRRPEGGLKVLGCPVGREEFILQVVTEKLESFAEHLDQLVLLQDLQLSLPILVQCFATRPCYLSRLLPPSPPLRERFSLFDLKMQKCLCKLLGIEMGAPEGVESLAIRQASLPISSGGVGLRQVTRSWEAALLGGWALVAHLVGERFVREGDGHFLRGVVEGVDGGTLPFQRELRAATDALPERARELLPPFPTVATTAERELQSKLTAVIEEAAWEQLLEDQTSASAKARLRSCSGPGASSWLTVRPIFPSLRMADDSRCRRRFAVKYGVKV